MKNEKVWKIAMTGVFAALSYVVFTFLQFKIWLPGGDATSIHFGNAVCVLGALILGGVYGGIGGAIGMTIGDLLDPVYVVYAPKTFILKFCIGLEKKEILLDYHGEPATIQGVRHVLYEMLYNIADNAVRYTNPGGHIHIYVGKRGGKPFYRVEDDGIGIPKSEQKRIFERFYRVDKSHSRQTGGTGLGLSIVKHGANLHHAKITVDSDLGKGTKMELLF